MVPFGNSLVIIPDASPAQLLSMLSASANEIGGGAFLHVSGLRLTIDLNAQPRLQAVSLTDGTPIVAAGQVVPNAPSVSIATINFIADGNAGIPIGGLPSTSLGITDQQAVSSFVSEPAGLDAQITSSAYPEGGEGRITVN
jgi:hypothetical protein